VEIDEWNNLKDSEFLSVLKFVNDLFKTFKTYLPLKRLIEYVLEKFELDDVVLYEKTGAFYRVVNRTGLLDNETFTQVLINIQLELNDTQVGINFSDECLKKFKKFYIPADEIPDLLAPSTQPASDKIQVSTKQNKLGEYQKLLITYSTFTHEQITCLLTNSNPAYSHNDDSFNAYYDMVENAIKAGKLTYDDEVQIPATQVKLWLSDHGYIFKGFNDNLQTNKPHNKNQLASQPDNQLKAENEQLKRRIAELEQQLHEVQSNQRIAQLQSLSYDWENMSENIYPPELHLALLIWEEYCNSEGVQYITQFDSSRFNAIAARMGLPDGNLRSRIRTIITNFRGKAKSPELISQLTNLQDIYSGKAKVLG